MAIEAVNTAEGESASVVGNAEYILIKGFVCFIILIKEAKL